MAEKNDSGTIGAVEATAERRVKNEVLAKWAGFIEYNCPGWGHKTWGWPDDPIPPEGQYMIRALPDLLHSLDALAEWCFPKLRELGIHTRFKEIGGKVRDWEPIGYRVFCCTDSQEGTRKGEAIGTNLPEACAEAILSLIGEDDG